MDTGTLVLIAIIVIAVVLLIKRLMPQQSPYSQQGNNRPQYDDPNVSSHGGFGGNQQGTLNNRPQNDDPNIESHGGFGSSGGSRSKLDQLAQGQSKPTASASSQRPTVERQPESGRRNDDENVSSHGGFGGQK